MALGTLGKITVTTGGTPVRATSTKTVVQSVLVQAGSANTGKMYIGNSSLNKSTLAGVYAVVPAPTTGVIPSVSFSIPLAPAGINLADIWVDADTNGETVLISYTEQ